MSLDAIGFSDAIVGAVEAAGASLVRVEARHRGGATGVVWSEDGVIIAAHHAVERDEGIAVTLPGGEAASATLVGRDPGTDLAVLRVEAKGLTPPRWAVPDGIKVGQVIVATARPGRTVRATLGIVSTFGEGFRTSGGGKLDRYVQIDADVQPGFSGGLVVGLNGQALGVTTAGLVRNAALVIPTPTVRRVVEELLAHGRIRRGYLGVGAYPVRLTPALEALVGRKFGVVFVTIEPGSPADKAALLLGDVLVALDGKPVEHPGDIVALLEDRAGTEVRARIVRAGVAQEVALTAAQRD